MRVRILVVDFGLATLWSVPRFPGCQQGAPCGLQEWALHNCFAKGAFPLGSPLAL